MVAVEVVGLLDALSVFGCPIANLYQGIEFVMAGEFTLCAFDFGNDFVVEADLVQVPAAVIQVVDLSAAGQTVSGVLFFRRHFPLVLTVFVVVEAGKDDT